MKIKENLPSTENDVEYKEDGNTNSCWSPRNSLEKFVEKKQKN